MAGEKEIFDQFQDLFADFFGGQGAAPTRGADLRQPLRISLAEAVEGARRDVVVSRPVPCAKCAGRGAPPDAVWLTCDDCKGVGGAVRDHGTLQITSTCETCRGRKGTWAPICATCDGTARVAVSETLTVHIPPGIDTGQHLRIAGKGEAGSGDLPPGNLLLAIEVEPDASFERHGDDLHTRAVLAPELARGGGPFELALPGGTRRITIKPGTQPGDSLVLRGFGAVKLGSPATPLPVSDEPYRAVDGTAHRGNVIVTFEVGTAPASGRLGARGAAVVVAAVAAGAVATLLYFLLD